MNWFIVTIYVGTLSSQPSHINEFVKLKQKRAQAQSELLKLHNESNLKFKALLSPLIDTINPKPSFTIKNAFYTHWRADTSKGFYKDYEIIFSESESAKLQEFYEKQAKSHYYTEQVDIKLDTPVKGLTTLHIRFIQPFKR